jgi:hypothetical protein
MYDQAYILAAIAPARIDSVGQLDPHSFGRTCLTYSLKSMVSTVYGRAVSQ